MGLLSYHIAFDRIMCWLFSLKKTFFNVDMLHHYCCLCVSQTQIRAADLI